MKKIITLTIGCFTIMMLSQCHKKMAPTGTPTAAEEVAAMKSKYSVTQMAKGQAISTANCGKCHELHQPGEFTIKRWNKILPEMCHKAELSKEDAELVRAWIITNAKAG